jgi:septal ring factor EnvC (AmiA/AmiB activator)
MIKNQAVVNEENTSPDYWKNRYHNEIALVRANTSVLGRANTLPNAPLGTSLMVGGSGSCLRCEQSLDPKLLLDAERQIQALTRQLKEETDKVSALKAKLEDVTERCRTTTNNRMSLFKLKEGQLIKLLADRKDPECSECDTLQNQIEFFKNEIEQLKMMQLDNPILT